MSPRQPSARPPAPGRPRAARGRVVGFDPGLERTGYGVVESRTGRTVCLAYGCITTPRTLAVPDRLYALSVALRELLLAYRPAVVGVETILFGRNVTTALVVGEARGVILLAAAAAGLPVVELTPLQVKQALTAYGRADKRQVQRMVREVLRLPTLPRPDDAADALAVAIAAERVHPFAAL